MWRATAARALEERIVPKDIFFQLPEVAQDKILMAAAETLRDHGLRYATLKDVAERLNIGAEMVERYFDDEKDLIAAVLGRAIQYFSQTYIEVGKMDRPFWDRVEYLLDVATRRGFQYQAFFEVYKSLSASGLADLTQATFDRFEGRAALFFQNLVLSGVQEGALRDDVDVSTMALHFQLFTRFLLARRYHPMFKARSKNYYPEIPMDDDGDRRLIKRLLISLKWLYSAN